MSIRLSRSWIGVFFDDCIHFPSIESNAGLVHLAIEPSLLIHEVLEPTFGGVRRVTSIWLGLEDLFLV